MPIIDRFSRTELLIGKESFNKLSSSRVAVFGVGGVGSFAAEALARSGIGTIDLFDGDKVEITNINRQIIADSSTLGLPKVTVMKNRILKINPSARVYDNLCFFNKDNASDYDFSVYDYVVDAIDTVTSKILIILKAKEEKVPIISSMGTANKLNPLALKIDDIYNTSRCPLARIMRKELKKRQVDSLKVVYSTENPRPCFLNSEDVKIKKSVCGSVSFVPSAAGLILCSQVVCDLIGYDF